MPFDWFTFVAQVLNFLILLMLLRRFLYGPITRVMSERKERIEAQLEEAREREREAEAILASYQQEWEKLELARQEVLARVRQEAEAARQALTLEARNEVEDARARWQRGLVQEQRSFYRQLRRGVPQALFELLRRVLIDVADERLESRIVEVFMERLRELPEAERRAFARGLRHAEGAVAVDSAFPVPQDLLDELERVIVEVFEPEVELRLTLHHEPELIGGFELRAHDKKLAWHLDGYLNELENVVAEQLEPDRAEPEVVAR